MIVTAEHTFSEQIEDHWIDILAVTIHEYPQEFEAFSREFKTEQEAFNFLKAKIKKVGLCLDFDVSGLEAAWGIKLLQNTKNVILAQIETTSVRGASSGGSITSYTIDGEDYYVVHAYGFDAISNSLGRHELSHLADGLIGISHQDYAETKKIFNLIRINMVLRRLFIGTETTMFITFVANSLLRLHLVDTYEKVVVTGATILIGHLMQKYAVARAAHHEKSYHRTASEAKANRLGSLSLAGDPFV